MDIYQHFRKEEHSFIDQVLSWMEQVERSYLPRLTDFLDPREQQIIEMLIGTSNDELKLLFFGGGTYSERKRRLLLLFMKRLTRIPLIYRYYRLPTMKNSSRSLIEMC